MDDDNTYSTRKVRTFLVGPHNFEGQFEARFYYLGLKWLQVRVRGQGSGSGVSCDGDG